MGRIPSADSIQSDLSLVWIKANNNLIESEVTSVKTASVSGLVDFERHFCVNGFVVRNDPVVPVPEDEGGDDGSGADEAREPELLADADVDDAIAGHDVDLPRNHRHVKLK